MPTLTRPKATPVVARTPPPRGRDPQPSPHTLAEAVALASAAVLELGLDDPRWAQAGPALTAFVDAARRAVDGSGSRIAADEAASPVLRLRDLGRLAQVAAAARAPRPAEVGQRLQSLQMATHQ